MPSEDVTLNAQFEIDSYTVVFKDFDGTVLYQEVLDYGSKVEYKGETISRDGYTFTGWNNEIPDTLPASDLEFIAEYSINSYNIVFKNHDGVVLYNELVEFNSVISYKGNTPQKEGYTFTKWNNEIPATMPANDLEFIAEFEINVYTVQFKNYDGTVLFTDNVEHGSSATYEGDTPTRPATKRFTYTFKEWDTDYSNITSDLIVVALYDEIKNYFILTTIVDGVSTEYKVNNGDNITLEDPVKEGHTFIRWTVDFSNLTDDLTTEALFSINSYKLTYKINGETKEEQIVVYNSDIILIEKPVIDGYYFVEWKNVVEKMPANDHVIELIYEEVVKITNVTKSGKTYDGEKVNDPVVTLSKDAYVEIQYFKDIII